MKRCKLCLFSHRSTVVGVRVGSRLFLGTNVGRKSEDSPALLRSDLEPICSELMCPRIDIVLGIQHFAAVGGGGE